MKLPCPRRVTGLLLLTFLSALLPGKAADQPYRTWTSKDGRSLEARYIKYSETSVTVRTREGRQLELPYEKLSEEDMVYAKTTSWNLGLEAQRQKGLKEGPYAASLTGEWRKMKSAAGIDYHFYAAKRLKPGQLYPLCIYLHGSSNTGSKLTKREPGADAFAKEEFYKERPCFIIAPEAPEGTNSFRQIVPQMTALVKDLGDHLPIDRDRIYLTGYSMGGYGSFDWIAAEPTLFAAAVPVAGFPGADLAKRLPKTTALWLQWGELDQADRAKALRDAIQTAGIPFKETEHKGADHVSFHYKVATDPAVHQWLFAQKRTAP
jgi:dipeptidyl aminopeptidase/acylaminoacyl peptidase